MTIHLIRHAHAGKRSEWDDDDSLRPLSSRGFDQANGLCSLLAEIPVGRVISSPYLRCLQTAHPIASHHGLMVEASHLFAEGASARKAYEVLLQLDEVDGVACSHGDIIPLLLRLAVGDGMETDGPLIDQKGSLWTIEMKNGRPWRGRYTPPFA